MFEDMHSEAYFCGDSADSLDQSSFAMIIRLVQSITTFVRKWDASAEAMNTLQCHYRLTDPLNNVQSRVSSA